MAGWSGLYDDVHGAPHALLAIPIPVSRELYREVQKKGNYGVALNIEDSSGNSMVVPATTLKVTTTGSDLGGSRVIAAESVVTAITDAQALATFSTKQGVDVVADLSGNGGGAYS